MEKGELIFQMGPMTLMFGGLAAGVSVGGAFGGILAPILLLGGYIGSMFWVLAVSPVASLIANKDHLMKALIRSTTFTYTKRVHNFWTTKDPLFNPETINSMTKIGGWNSMTIGPLKEPFNHPRWGPLYKVRIMWQGDLTKRLLHGGCTVSRWGIPSFKHNTGDEVILYERPIDDFHPEATSREPSNYTIPEYILKEAPGDIYIAEDAETRRKMSLFPATSRIRR